MTLTEQNGKPQDGTLMLQDAVPSDNEARGIVARKAAPIGAGPRAWLGPSKMTDAPEDDSSDDTECPTCGRDDFSRRQGMKVHHVQAHGESIAGAEISCAWCGKSKRILPCHVKEKNFCDKSCYAEWYSENKTGENSPSWKEDVTFVCEQCGGTSQRDPSEAKRRRFCSHECHNQWRAENPTRRGLLRTEVACERCGAPILRYPSSLAGKNFCSEDCQHEYQRGEGHPLWNGGTKTVLCKECNAAFQRKRYKKDRGFCSRECYGKWLSREQIGEDNPVWTGGAFPYGEGWGEAKKERVRERQNRECAGCGTHESDLPRKMDVHHIQKARSFGAAKWRNAESNLVALCHGCHAKWEKISPLAFDVRGRQEGSL